MTSSSGSRFNSNSGSSSSGSGNNNSISSMSETIQEINLQSSLFPNQTFIESYHIKSLSTLNHGQK